MLNKFWVGVQWVNTIDYSVKKIIILRNQKRVFTIKLNKNRFLSKSWKGYLARKVLSMSIHSSEFFRILLNIFGLIFLRKELIDWIILIYSQSLVLWESGIVVPSINWGVSIWLTHSRSIALCGVKLIDWKLIRGEYRSD